MQKMSAERELFRKGWPSKRTKRGGVPQIPSKQERDMKKKVLAGLLALALTLSSGPPAAARRIPPTRPATPPRRPPRRRTPPASPRRPRRKKRLPEDLEAAAEETPNTDAGESGSSTSSSGTGTSGNTTGSAKPSGGQGTSSQKPAQETPEKPAQEPQKACGKTTERHPSPPSPRLRRRRLRTGDSGGGHLLPGGSDCLCGLCHQRPGDLARYDAHGGRGSGFLLCRPLRHRHQAVPGADGHDLRLRR